MTGKVGVLENVKCLIENLTPGKYQINLRRCVCTKCRALKEKDIIHSRGMEPSTTVSELPQKTQHGKQLCIRWPGALHVQARHKLIELGVLAGGSLKGL